MVMGMTNDGAGRWEDKIIMGIINIIILGVVQGFTEFLPVSSSGHLVILQNLLGINESNITLDIFLHTGTLLSVIIVFRKDIINILAGFFRSLNFRKKEETGYGKLAWLIILANIPVGIAGVFFKDQIEVFFTGGQPVYFFLIFTGIFLFLSRFTRKADFDIKGLTFIKALIIGFFQMLAILPGVSRSGITITMGILLKMNRKDAARFSFFLMLPAVAGATLLEIKNLESSSLGVLELTIGILVSFLSGYAAIKILLVMVKNYKLHYFSYYCISIGILGLIFL